MPIVITKAPPPRPGRPLDLDPPITSVEVVADPSVTQGRKCPVYVNFKGRITAGSKSQYETFNTKYRFVGDHDYKSEWIFVSLKRGETRTVNGRRFIQQTDDPRGLTTPSGGASRDRQPSLRTVDRRATKAPEKVPVFHGWMMVEVMLSNDDVKQSAKTNFTVDCNPRPAGQTIKSSP